MSDPDSPAPSSGDPSSGAGSPRKRPSSGDEAARVLKEVMKDQAERRARQEEATRRKEKNRLLPLPVVALAWAAAALAAWVWTPAFLLPDPLPEPTPAQVETGLRMEMLSVVTRIERYRDETGRVPQTLDRILEEPPADVGFVTFSSDSYQLTGSRGGTQIVYESGDPIEELVGDATERIRNGVGEETGSGGETGAGERR